MGTSYRVLTLLFGNGTGAIKIGKIASFWEILDNHYAWAYTSNNVILGLLSLLSTQFLFCNKDECV